MKFLLLSLLAAFVAATVPPEEVFGFTDEIVLERVDVTPDGGIKKIVLKKGSGDVPNKGDKIHAHYDGRLASDGKQFDSSYNRGQPFSFTLGQGQVIQGWDKGFAGMSLGEKAILVIDPKYGYGARGAGGVIPGGATLYFSVELMQIGNKKKSDEL